MRPKSLASVATIALLVLAGTGCQSMDRIFYRPDPARIASFSERSRNAGVHGMGASPASECGQEARLPGCGTGVSPLFAADRGMTPCGCQKASTLPASEAVLVAYTGDDAAAAPAVATPMVTTQPAGEPDVSTRPAATQPARPPYSSPGAAVRAMNFVGLAASLGAFQEAGGAGREFSETLAASRDLVGGRTGLTAPQTTAVSAITGRPGLVEGEATGLSFASPVHNIFTARLNRATGPGGRCGELTNAGFFGGNRTACEQHFRRR